MKFIFSSLPLSRWIGKSWWRWLVRLELEERVPWEGIFIYLTCVFFFLSELKSVFLVYWQYWILTCYVFHLLSLDLILPCKTLFLDFPLSLLSTMHLYALVWGIAINVLVFSFFGNNRECICWIEFSNDIFSFLERRRLSTRQQPQMIKGFRALWRE